MAGTFIKPEDILKATQGGLDIILQLYPDAQLSVDRTGRKFKVRPDEKTASASLKRKLDDNYGIEVYLVTDFGGDGVTRNGIGCYALENRLEWVEALKQLGARYGVTGEDFKPEVFKAVYTDRPADPDMEPEGLWTFDVKDSFSDFEIETLFSKYTLKFVGWDKGEQKRKDAYSRIAGVLKKYHFWPLASYTMIKNRKAMTFSATDVYPMFIIDEKISEDKSFKKIYQPRHEDKGRRFMYYGEKPKNFIHGLAQAAAEFKKREDAVLADDQDYDQADDDTKQEKRKVEKLDEFILASGGSDALNLAVLGYWVGWMNSETAGLLEKDFFAMVKVAKKVYQLQDIDETGKRSAHDLAMQYLDLYTIELPDLLRQKRDARMNPCKDLRDYLNHWDRYELERLLKDALPYRFWEMQPEFAGRGENKVRVGWKYEFDNVQAYNFLRKNGFHRFPVEGEKAEYIFIQVDGNIVRQVSAVKVKNWLHRFLRDRRMEKDLRNTLFRSTQLNESSLSNLDETEIDFTDCDARTQFQFFSNITWEITAGEIREHKPGAIKRFVWEDDVLDRRVKLLDSPFEIKKSPGGDTWTIDLKNTECLFLRFLVQTSRIHWRAELEDAMSDLGDADAEAYRAKHKFDIAGPALSDDQREEQVLHLVNKLFTIGYLLHRHKSMDKTWAVRPVDGKLSEDGQSHGRSGKSIAFNLAINQVLKKRFVISGSNPKIVDNQHIYHGLTEHDRWILIDDADRYLPFRFFFESVTTGQTVNPKNGKPFYIPFEKLGKYVFISNFVKEMDPSERGRSLSTVFGDYYHLKDENGEYKENKQPKDDFGKILFQEFDDKEWNLFHNTMARCLQFFLSVSEKIDAPMGNVERRTLQQTMGENFEAWASVYFSPESGNVDRLVIRERAVAEFMAANKNTQLTPQGFTKKLKAYCKFNHYALNPAEFINSADKKRIIRNLPEEVRSKDGIWSKLASIKSYELFYIRTDFENPLNDLMAGESVVPF